MLLVMIQGIVGRCLELRVSGIHSCASSETALIHAAGQGHTHTDKYVIDRGANDTIPTQFRGSYDLAPCCRNRRY
ncbi:hypothetical protein TanjilG_26442 [Lupinus angustifolius]|uniref:Uncharacterized protein n=1 Tax=Lupinus angustifolius TaxID=3871 RepID=A0A4P1R2V7_LUPAN|nr:hypothetical protein TanjilG_26442 [Lupinus angustifolius]